MNRNTQKYDAFVQLKTVDQSILIKISSISLSLSLCDAERHRAPWLCSTAAATFQLFSYYFPSYSND